MSVKSLNQLARMAYAAYCQRAGGKTFDDKPLPDWLALGAERQACWIEATRAVADQVKHLH